MAGKEEKLTKKQELFCLEFIKDMNATRAYKEVYGAKQNVAEVNGCKLLSNTKVRNFLKDKLQEKFDKANIDGQWVIDRLVELVDRCMQRKPVMEYDKEQKEYVQVQDIYEDPETGEKQLVGVWTFDSSGANRALENLGKYFNLFVNRHELTGKDGEPLSVSFYMPNNGRETK